jgi:arylsulfatase A-like enzyme
MAPYRSSFAAAVGTALGAGALTALVDTLLTLRAASGQAGGGGGYLLVAVALYLGVALVLGLGEGLVAGAVRATHGPGGVAALWRRLVDDPEHDRRVAAGLLAAAACALLYALAVAVLALGLVAGVERKTVGALLLGFVAAGLAGGLVLAWYPAYRVARPLARVVPRLGRLPATALLVGLAGLGGAGAVAFVLFTKLDWRVLNLGAPLMLLAFGALQLGLLLLFYGPLAGVRERLPARGALVAAGGVAAIGLAAVVVTSVAPSQRTLALLADHGQGARALVGVARRLGDGDKDGFSRFLGGGDCDDGSAAVNPAARDLPGNGIDENCNGQDTPARAPAPGAAAADAGPPPGPAAFAWKGNILVIAVDTLRADRLGAVGYQRGGKSLTPRIDALVDKGVLFERAWAQAPHTPRSFPSFFTSRYPSAIKWDKAFSNYPKLLDENLTVWEALAGAGITTVGEASHFYFTAERGITQGFASFDNADAKNLKDSNTDIASPRIVPRATAKLKELAAAKQRFAMFVHLFEPHSTYVVHEGVQYQEAGRGLFVEKYDREIEFVDRWVGELVDGLAAAGLAEDTLIVLVADHGEEFFTHSYGGQALGWHGQSLYDDVQRVPLLFVAPGLTPRRVKDPVMLIDVAPTLLDVAGVPVPSEFQGRTLAPALAGEPLAPRDAHAELLPYPNFNVAMRMIVTDGGRYKLIRNQTDNTRQLFDLEADPGELKNLAFDQPDLARKLEDQLTEWVDRELQ